MPELLSYWTAFLGLLELEPYRQWLAFFVPQERIFALYLLSSFALAFFSYVYYGGMRGREKPDTKGGFLRYVFGHGAYTHKSAVQDYIFFFTNAVIFYFLLQQFLVSQNVFLSSTYALANTFLDKRAAPLFPAGWDIAAYTLLMVLASDFAIFLTHYLCHKNPILWEFHKVHHSAEVLNPMTLHRMHPLDLIFTALVAAGFMGIAAGVFFYLQGGLPREFQVFGLNVVLFAFYIFGYNLRHSQVWVAYPRWLSHLLISPAQHQIHHSTALKHRDKNFSLVFAIWDKMFGTLYVPAHYEKIDFGIDVKERNPFPTVTSLYLSPFKWAFADLKANRGREQFLWILGTLFSITFFFYLIYAPLADKTARSVYLEELTWTETAKALSDGYDTALIPTGGTEQNGVHVVLGKHNYVVRHNAGEAARRARRALVAPVIAYVPEETHMGYAGTLSLSEATFEKTLTEAAESLQTHGFKYIFFIGDSFGNQAPQEKVAAALQKKWREQGVTVASLSRYYKENGQIAALMKQGYLPQEIGGHAGIRDTSEMIYLHPDGVRRKSEFLPLSANARAGSDGNYALASRAIGKKMTELKIIAAVEEIKSLRPDAADARVIEANTQARLP